ncbi:uncharacterized protein TRAVEDRAFT_70705 [Trametes versicolor FP-101664 SS1]|uniref:uncharacterized protein n=1 Tax=Trametes versicolor (strain FP-101664) TaxID=717944 RepID=UPI00046235B7|nr:uncharacterized protein TRAVEDRAFT_70705 [Trametes versicolor FP-101664 SS1]EIW60268.1 hypothetical protein TRAVEDRAFT_70705 [Trametes versicolor FP-101664 SS1]
MCYPSSIAAALGKEIKFCALTGGLDVYLFILASLSGVVFLAGLLFTVTRLVTAKVALVSLGVFVQVLALWSSSSPWVSGKVQLLAGLCILCSAWFFAQSAPLERSTAFLQAQVVSLHDTLRYSNERTAALRAELREVQAAISVKDNTIRDLQAGVDLEDDTVYDSDATVVGGDSDTEDIVTALNALRAECAQNAILLSNARNAHNATMEAKNAKVAQLKAELEEAKKVVMAQRKELADTVREIAEMRVINTRCEAEIIFRDQEIARKDRTIAACENELASLQNELANTRGELVNTHRELANTQSVLASTQDQLTDTQSVLKDAQDVIGPISAQFEEYEADNMRIRDKLEAKLMLRDLEIESLKMKLASALNQTGAQPMDTSDSSESTLCSPRPDPSSSAFDRHCKLTSLTPTPSPSSPARLSSSSAHCPASPVQSCPLAEEPSFTIEDKLAEMDVSCDLLRDEYSFFAKGQDSCWIQESPVQGKCALKPKEVDASGRRSSCSETSSFQIPAILGVSRDLLHDKYSFLAQDKDSHWLTDTPEKPKVVVRLQDVPAGVESSGYLCADGKKSSFVMRLDNVSCDLLNDKMSIPSLKDEDSGWSQESLLKHLPPIERKKGKIPTSSAPKGSWGEPRAAGDKSSFVMRVDDMSCDLLRDNASFLPKDQGSSWLGDSKSSKMAVPSVFPRNSRGKEKISSRTTHPLEGSFSNNLSNEFAQLVENASTPAKRSGHHTEGTSPQPPSLSFMTISSSMDAHAFASLRPHRRDTCFLTPAFTQHEPAKAATPSPPQGSSKHVRRKNLLKTSGTFQPLTINAPRY